MGSFAKFHPVVILVYYVLAAVLMVWAGHPVLCGLIWLICLADYGCMEGRKKTWQAIVGSMAAAVFCMVVNPLLNHRGVTLLFMLGDVRITGEALLYGANMSAILLASLMLFSCLSRYLTAEKIMVLFGGRFPSFALLFSMILRLVPKAGRDFREMCSRHGNRPAAWSALMGFMLEDSMERSISMQNKGYGTGERSSFYRKRFTSEDIAVLAGMGGIFALTALFLCRHPVVVRFFPSVRIEAVPVCVWVLLSVFFMVPLLLRGKDELRWYLSRRRITSSGIRGKNSPPCRLTDGR